VLRPKGDAAAQVQAAKQAVRGRVWELLDRSGAALPPGAQGRIPMFEGADAAADRLAGLTEWQAAGVVKANPDWAQMPVRTWALAAGKIVYMAVPRLAGDRPFVMLDPARLPDPVEQAGDKDRALELGQLVQVEQLQQVDLVVAGSVAVNRNGARVGKGGGFSDIEVALLVEAGVIGPGTQALEPAPRRCRSGSCRRHSHGTTAKGQPDTRARQRPQDPPARPAGTPAPRAAPSARAPKADARPLAWIHRLNSVDHFWFAVGSL
jgi:5-formyltetrahydrofolate cyclo-ligase